MKLKPSAKIKRRYILFQNANKKEIEEIILEGIGTLGWAKASPVFVKNKNNHLILSIDRASINDVRAAIELSLKNIQIKKVSGTLKGLNL